jgi:hypothetical protein
MMPQGANQDHGTERKVLAFGGTGKTVALIYSKICKLLDEEPRVAIWDFPASDDTASPDGQIDRDLQEEGLGDDFRIRTLPRTVPDDAPATFVQTFGIPEDVADALYTQAQQDTPPTDGLNQEPQIGASVGQFKVRLDADVVRQMCITGEPEMFFVGGLGGGTGTGLPPVVARFLRPLTQSRFHGVFLLPWNDIGQGGRVNNENQDRNAWSMLRYLNRQAEDLYTDTLIIGSPQGVDRARPAPGAAPVHPTLILAALSMHMFFAWGGGAQLTERFRRFETFQTGITLHEITARDGTSLYQRMIHSIRLERLLRELANQFPDERLALFSLFPMSCFFAWPALEHLLKLYARHVNASSYTVAWHQISARLLGIADQERRRRQWITALASDRRLFQFDPEGLERDARSQYDRYRGALEADHAYETFRLEQQGHDAALAHVCQFIRDWAAAVVLREMLNHERRATPSAPENRSMRVWLPGNFTPSGNRTGITALTSADRQTLIQRLMPVHFNPVCPEVLGHRMSYIWRLAQDLQAGHGGALDDFNLLIEGINYGLLSTHAYDLSRLHPQGGDGPAYNFDFIRDEDRYLIILKYRSSQGANPVVAGTFSPDTLVCPAANWRQRAELERQVNNLRLSETGMPARGLLDSLFQAVNSPEMLWARAGARLLANYAPERDPGIANQRNVGPLQLRMAENAPPQLVFVPQYNKQFVPFLVNCLNGEYTKAGNTPVFRHQSRTIAEIRTPVQCENPRLFGLGGIDLPPNLRPTDVPALNSLNGEAEERYLSAVRVVVASYDRELEYERARFRVPESLLPAYLLWGRAAKERLTRGTSPIIYGDRAAALTFDPKPDQLSSEPGLHESDGYLFYVSRTTDGRLAYHIERCGGVDVGELSTLGYALWKFFSEAGGSAAGYVQDRRGWVGARTDLQLSAPDLDSGALYWCTFLYVLGMPQADALFVAAVGSYTKRFEQQGMKPAKLVEYRALTLFERNWFQVDAM